MKKLLLGLKHPGALYALFVLISLLFVSLHAPRAEAAFGISPPFIHADRLVAGSSFTETIYLVQDQPNADLPIKTALEIPAKIRGWIELDQGLNFTIPAGVRQYPVQVAIRVPKGAALGVWNGKITFTAAPSGKGQVAIALGAQAQLNISVGNDIYRQFKIPVIRLLDIEEGWNPRVYVKFQNDGNVPEIFTAATYELSDQFDAARLAFAQTRKDFSETPPFTVKEYTVEFPINFHLGIGQYWGNVAFYQEEKVVGSQKTVFNVLERGTLKPPSLQLADVIKRKEVQYAGAGILVLILVVSMFKIAKRRKPPRA